MSLCVCVCVRLMYFEKCALEVSVNNILQTLLKHKLNKSYINILKLKYDPFPVNRGLELCVNFCLLRIPSGMKPF